MPTPIASLRIAKETLAALKRLAREEAVKRNVDVQWSDLVRQLIQDRLAQEKVQATRP